MFPQLDPKELIRQLSEHGLGSGERGLGLGFRVRVCCVILTWCMVFCVLVCVCVLVSLVGCSALSCEGWNRRG